LFNHRSPDGVDDPHVRIADKIPSMPRGTRSTHLLLVNVKLSCDGGVVETSPHRSLGNLSYRSTVVVFRRKTATHMCRVSDAFPRNVSRIDKEGIVIVQIRAFVPCTWPDRIGIPSSCNDVHRYRASLPLAHGTTLSLTSHRASPMVLTGTIRHRTVQHLLGASRPRALDGAALDLYHRRLDLQTQRIREKLQAFSPPRTPRTSTSQGRRLRVPVRGRIARINI
jgi:hypothetical protein